MVPTHHGVIPIPPLPEKKILRPVKLKNKYNISICKVTDFKKKKIKGKKKPKCYKSSVY